MWDAGGSAAWGIGVVQRSCWSLRGEADWDSGVLTKSMFGFGCDPNHLPSMTAFLVNGPRLSFLELLHDFLRKSNLVA